MLVVCVCVYEREWTHHRTNEKKNEQVHGKRGADIETRKDEMWMRQ